MSWFEYGVPERRSLRKGVFLRVRDLPPALLSKARTYMKRGEQIEMVKVLEIRPDNYVYLEFWCLENRQDIKKKILFERRVVFGFLEQENPKWICEGDLGRGYKE